MAKRLNSISPEVHKDVLIKTHEQFNKELEERLEIGQELLNRQISSTTELSSSKEDFNLWDDYNKELLKQSFDRPNNDYHRDYCFTGISYSLGHPRSLAEILQEHKSDINRQITRLRKIREKSNLIESKVIQPVRQELEKDETQIGLEKLYNLFSKFHRIAQTLRSRHDFRPTLIVNDEYDVQDLLRAILKEHFNDVREEDYVPSYAGSNSRVDFVLKNEKIVIETKMTNDWIIRNILTPSTCKNPE